MMAYILTLVTDSGRQMKLFFDDESGTVFAEMQDTGVTFWYNKEAYETVEEAAQLIRTGYHGEEPDFDEMSDDDILPIHGDAAVERRIEHDH